MSSSSSTRSEQVIDVPKIIFEDIPSRTPPREPRLAEQLVEVLTEPVFVEHTVDIPVPCGGGRRGELQGPVLGQGWWRSSYSKFSPRTGFNSVILMFSLSKTTRMSRLKGFLALFSPVPKKCEGHRAVECESARHSRSSELSAHLMALLQATWLDDSGTRGRC